MPGFLLGLSLGTSCLLYCAPVLMPYLLGRGQKVWSNLAEVGLFLLGRLIGYLVFGLAAWGVGRSLLEAAGPRDIVFGSAFLILAVLLLFQGFFKTEKDCPAGRAEGRFSKIMAIWPAPLPLAAGLVTGLSLCPPFLLAFTHAAAAGGLFQSVWFFVMFFLGTSVFFLPAPLVGFLRVYPSLKIIGKIATGIMGLYYLYLGSFTLWEGVLR
ncbi:MAG: sulfite exporter TauE/SafE family protein [Thermodesulfobacteriota bacterium]